MLRRRALLRAGLATYLLLVLGLTLVPRGGEGAAWRICVACGERGLADALLNVLMFVPVGLGVRLWTGSWSRALFAGVLFSAGIEAIQLFVPGRFANVGDILSNGVGAAAGAALPAIRAWRDVAARPPASGVALPAGLAAAALLLGTGWLAAPTVSDGRYFVFWTPELGHLASTDGRVLRATVAGVPRPHGWAPDPARLRGDLATASRVDLLIEPGHPTAGLAGLFAVYDDRQREVLLVGRERDDLVLRWRTRAAGLRLDRPDVLAADFFARLAARDTVALSLRPAPERAGRCLEWWRGTERASARERSRCGLGITVGRGWDFLLPFRAGAPVRPLLDGAWIFSIALALGLAWMPSPAGWAGTLLLAGALVGAPLGTVLLPTPPWLYAAAAAGFAVGALLRRRGAGGDGGGQEPASAIVSATEAQQPAMRS